MTAIEQYILTRFHMLANDEEHQTEHIRFAKYVQGYLRLGNLWQISDEVSDIFNTSWKEANDYVSRLYVKYPEGLCTDVTI